MFIKNFADDGIRTEPQPLPKNVFLAFQYEAEKMETGGVSYAVYLYYMCLYCYTPTPAQA